MFCLTIFFGDGNPKDMKRVVNLIKQNTSYRKGESRGTRGYI